MPDGQERTRSSVAAAQYVLAVRERHHGDASEQALDARLRLAEALKGAGLHSEAIEILSLAVMDSSRLRGPDDERTLGVRLRLGDAHLDDDDPVMALCVHLALLDDA